LEGSGSCLDVPVWWRSAGVVAIELDAVIREKTWARTAGP
jgi:hypothetical protein